MTSKPTVRFDTSIIALSILAEEVFGLETLQAGLILRDASGRLTFVIRSDVDVGDRSKFDLLAAERLGGYVDGSPSATPDELLDPTLAEMAVGHPEPVTIQGKLLDIQVLDRRIVGQDWNAPDFNFDAGIPVFTFFSCKGGVGRSTALAIAATALSDNGINVAIIDADLEAPGIGSILLTEDDLPEYGALDYFVEYGIGAVDREFVEKCIAPSPLTGGRGLVEVIPAVGKASLNNPANVLPKLGRAFIDKIDEEGRMASHLHQMQSLVRAVARRGRSNVILVDARSGLSESSAATVVGLGGNVFLFGVDTPQTFECYRYLFAQLRAYILDQGAGEWRFGLQMVHAKAGRGAESFEHFRDQSAALFSEFLYDEADANDLEAFNFDLDDDAAPHFAWPIPFDADYVEFDPRARRDQLSQEFFMRSYGTFVRNLLENIEYYQAATSD